MQFKRFKRKIDTFAKETGVIISIKFHPYLQFITMHFDLGSETLSYTYTEQTTFEKFLNEVFKEVKEKIK